MKRILYFLTTNIAILVVLSITINVLGLDIYLEQGGMNYQGLLIFAAIFGMGGSFISLLMSKMTAKRFSGARVIDQPGNEVERWYLDTVRRQAEAAGIGTPEAAIFDSPQVNAFATGARKNDALVAVSTGLLRAMSRQEAEAVIGHEISHVAIVDRVVFKSERGHGPGFWITTIIAQLVLGILASIIVMYFSRQREFRADAGGAELAGRENMISSLEKLRQVSEQPPLPDQLAAFGISGSVGQGFRRLFMSHPPLEERIAALRVSG